MASTNAPAVWLLERVELQAWLDGFRPFALARRDIADAVITWLAIGYHVVRLSVDY